MTTKDLIAEAASLPVEERVLLVDTVLRSLNTPNADIDRRWAEVARRRLDEIRSGDARPIPGDEVFGRIWKRFQA